MNSTVILSNLQVEQLSDHTGEESIILTASNDGSLSYLGYKLCTMCTGSLLGDN